MTTKRIKNLLESIKELRRALEIENQMEQVAIRAKEERAQRLAAYQEHVRTTFEVPDWVVERDPEPDVDCLEWEEYWCKATGKPRHWWRPGDPPRKVINYNGQAIDPPENRLGDIEAWIAEGKPSNAPATK